MTLDRNPTNYFAETEQVAFHPGHLVPGIDVTDDPLLQARLLLATSERRRDSRLAPPLGPVSAHEGRARARRRARCWVS